MKELEQKVKAQARRDLRLLLQLSDQKEFRRLLEELRATPREARLDRALELFDVDAMRASGVRLPEGVQSSIDVPPQPINNVEGMEPPPLSVTFDVCFKASLGPIEVSKCYKVTVENPDVDIL